MKKKIAFYSSFCLVCLAIALLLVSCSQKKEAAELTRIELEVFALANSDRDSARKREMVIKDKTPAILAYLLTVLFGALLGILIFGPEIKEANKAVVFSMAGSLGTVWIAAMAYYHGSSRGSAEKDIILRDKK